MFQPFGAKHLSEIDQADLQALIDDQVPEGLFVEYKRDWSSRKVARAVASFANSQGGGWLIVGVEANKLLPTKIVALQDTGDLEERVVHTIRSSVAPVPTFVPRAVQINPGMACIVVQVLEGTQPPYILIRTGQVLIRTATSSEPVNVHDREALFALGERGRIWAREQAEALRGTAYDTVGARLVTIPAVDRGLAAIPAIFAPSFVQAMRDELRHHHMVDSVFLEHKVKTGMSEDVVGLQAPTEEEEGSFASIHVFGSGIIRSEWVRPGNGVEVPSLKWMLGEWALPSHGRLYETHLGHRGDVVVVASTHWRDTTGASTATFVANPPVSLEELSALTFHEYLGRAIDRSRVTGCLSRGYERPRDAASRSTRALASGAP
jgi:hypothetical protein